MFSLRKKKGGGHFFPGKLKAKLLNDAIKHYAQGLAIKPSSESWVHQAQLYIKLGDTFMFMFSLSQQEKENRKTEALEKAIESCRSALIIVPESKDALLCRAKINSDLNRHLSSLDDLEKLIELFPNDRRRYADRIFVEADVLLRQAKFRAQYQGRLAEIANNDEISVQQDPPTVQVPNSPETYRASTSFERLGLVEEGTQYKHAKARYYQLAKRMHPDRGGNTIMFQLLRDAIQKLEERREERMML